MQEIKIADLREKLSRLTQLQQLEVRRIEHLSHFQTQNISAVFNELCLLPQFQTVTVEEVEGNIDLLLPEKPKVPIRIERCILGRDGTISDKWYLACTKIIQTGNMFQPEEIEALRSCSPLESIELIRYDGSCKVTYEYAKELKAQLPHLRILWDPAGYGISYIEIFLNEAADTSTEETALVSSSPSS
ncbi:MAG TPA: hypothetical protein VN457_03255 [Chlamydiales bacterium]|nr:hypothetical protein [Chlamydiales bacterium]